MERQLAADRARAAYRNWDIPDLSTIIEPGDPRDLVFNFEIVECLTADGVDPDTIPSGNTWKKAIRETCPNAQHVRKNVGRGWAGVRLVSRG